VILIVGLGNPGKEYSGTRHNVGFDTVENLAKRHGMRFRGSRAAAVVAEGIIAGTKVAIVKPLTFMNLSGQAVRDLANYYRVSHQEIVVVCDDVNLPLGKLRIRPKGSAGGHNGLKSIIQCIQGDDFIRVRIGVGSPRGEMIEHVLSRFARAERDKIATATARAADSLEEIASAGIDQAMNLYNPDPDSSALDKQKS
jgi:PTH1 family peptidyl-tRNA hydrolase